MYNLSFPFQSKNHFLIISFILIFCIQKTIAGQKADTIDNNIILFTGFEYTKGIVLYNETPFFMSADPFVGSVKYQGNWFSNLKLKYDCKEDVLVLIDIQNRRQIETINEKLDEFYLNDHHFIKINNPSVPQGFYEQLYNGKMQFLVKWQKKTERNQSEELHYIPYRQMYIFRENQFYKIKTLKDFLRIEQVSKNKIIKYCNQNHIKFKKNPVQSMQSILTYLEKDSQ